MTKFRTQAYRRNEVFFNQSKYQGRCPTCHKQVDTQQPNNHRSDQDAGDTERFNGCPPLTGGMGTADKAGKAGSGRQAGSSNADSVCSDATSNDGLDSRLTEQPSANHLTLAQTPTPPMSPPAGGRFRCPEPPVAYHPKHEPGFFTRITTK